MPYQRTQAIKRSEIIVMLDTDVTHLAPMLMARKTTHYTLGVEGHKSNGNHAESGWSPVQTLSLPALVKPSNLFQYLTTDIN